MDMTVGTYRIDVKLPSTIKNIFAFEEDCVGSRGDIDVFIDSMGYPISSGQK
jgi:hypothetical protein